MANDIPSGTIYLGTIPPQVSGINDQQQVYYDPSAKKLFIHHADGSNHFIEEGKKGNACLRLLGLDRHPSEIPSKKLHVLAEAAQAVDHVRHRMNAEPVTARDVEYYYEDQIDNIAHLFQEAGVSVLPDFLSQVRTELAERVVDKSQNKLAKK
ncbi:MAG: hypothetical protein Q7S00_05605 [bacterium]|nr:hypothetical protein [bacterium]